MGRFTGIYAVRWGQGILWHFKRKATFSFAEEDIWCRLVFDNDYNTKGIGWDRIILDILNSRENPYVVGNEYGITGFFKKESLKK